MVSRVHSSTAIVLGSAAAIMSCSDYPPPPLSRVALEMSVTGPSCDRQDPRFVTVGRFEAIAGGELRAHGVTDYSEADGYSTSLQCFVRPERGETAFQIGAVVQLLGPDTALFSVRGRVEAGATSESDVAVRINAHNAAYNPRRCFVSFTTGQQTIRTGELWATVSCPNAEVPPGSLPPGSPPMACDVVTTLHLRGCPLR